MLFFFFFVLFQLAVKTSKKPQKSVSECKQLREFIFLSLVPAHQSLVTTYEMFWDFSTRKFSIVMESMETSLIGLLDSRGKVPFSVESLKLILYQVLAGLQHVHSHGFFHRDVKPENILVRKVSIPPSRLFALAKARKSCLSCQQCQSDDNSSIETNQTCCCELQNALPFSQGLTKAPSLNSTHSTSTQTTLADDDNQQLCTTEYESYIIKLADFGLTRCVECTKPYTSYVSTRWYRAPELLLRSGAYSCPIDVWAFGTMAAEVSNLKPLFPGSNEPDQVCKQINLLGYPGCNSIAGTWRNMPALMKNYGAAMSSVGPRYSSFKYFIAHSISDFDELIASCLQWNPSHRKTVSKLLASPFFDDCEQATSILFDKRHQDLELQHTHYNSGAVKGSHAEGKPAAMCGKELEKKKEEYIFNPLRSISEPTLVHFNKTSYPPTILDIKTTDLQTFQHPKKQDHDVGKNSFNCAAMTKPEDKLVVADDNKDKEIVQEFSNLKLFRDVESNSTLSQSSNDDEEEEIQEMTVKNSGKDLTLSVNPKSERQEALRSVLNIQILSSDLEPIANTGSPFGRKPYNRVNNNNSCDKRLAEIEELMAEGVPSYLIDLEKQKANTDADCGCQDKSKTVSPSNSCTDGSLTDGDNISCISTDKTSIYESPLQWLGKHVNPFGGDEWSRT